MVDIIGRGALADVDIPEAKHLVPLYLDLSLAIACRDCCAIRRHTAVIRACITGMLHIICQAAASNHRALILHLGTIKVLSMRRRLTLAD